MTTSAEAMLIQRADLTIANLTSDGGMLLPEQANQFIDYIVDEPTILPQARMIRMGAPSVKINRMGFGERIMHAANTSGGENDNGTNSRYLLAAQRSRPTTSQIELFSVEKMAEIRLPYEALEDNIEGMSFEEHMMRSMAKQVALDMEEFALWGDTASADPDLAQMNGWLKRASAHVVDNGGLGVNPDLFTSAMLALPQKYLKYLQQMRGYVSMANMIRYRKKVSERQTGYGDSALQNTIPLYAGGLQLEGAPSLAMDAIGATGLVTFPKNLIWGIRRDISVETDRDIRSREYIIVVTVRCGMQIDDTNAVVKLEDI